MSLLSCESLHAGYNGKTVIKNISLSFQEGSMVSVIGPNGSGKSTLLKCLGRLIKPTEGRVFLDGRSISMLNSSEIARNIGILAQSPSAPEDIPVHCLAAYGRSPYKKIMSSFTKEDREIVNWAVSAAGLDDKRHMPIGRLSGGERQRAWIAMALAQQPKILLLDEPTTYLDIHHQFEILELLQKLNKNCGLTVVMVLHDLNLASRFSGRMIALKNGETALDGNSDEVVTEKNLYDIFRVKSRITESDGCRTALYTGVA